MLYRVHFHFQPKVKNHVSRAFFHHIERKHHISNDTKILAFIYYRMNRAIAKSTELIAASMSSYFPCLLFDTKCCSVHHGKYRETEKKTFVCWYSCSLFGIISSKRNSLCSCKFPLKNLNWNGRDNVMKVERNEKKNKYGTLNIKVKFFFSVCSLFQFILGYFDASFMCAFFFAFVFVMMNRFHCVNWTKHRAGKKMCFKQFQVCWYDSLYLQAILAHTLAHMTEKIYIKKKWDSLEIESPFMCWVECVPNQLRIQWFTAKVCTCVLRIQALSPTLNLVHRSSDSGFLTLFISSFDPFLFHFCQKSLFFLFFSRLLRYILPKTSTVRIFDIR